MGSEYSWVTSFCPLKEISQLAPACGAVELSPVPVGMVQALSPAGCCAALEPSLAGKPGHGECSTLHWGGREAALRVTVAKLPSISQLQDRTVLLCNLWPFYILVIYVLVMIEASGPHLTLHCSSSSQTLCGGWVHPLQLQHHGWDIVLINSQGT